ncbi:Oligopeptide transport system permease protein AppC [uncultured Gammaproteobacteria bacterium]
MIKRGWPPAAVAGVAILVPLAGAVLGVPLVEAALGITGETIDLMLRFSSPSMAHPLGCDELGRDVLVRLLRGGRVSLLVGLVAALVAGAIGATIGLISGYLGGRVDALLMRMTDAMIALPLLPLLIVLAAVDAGRLGLPVGLFQPEDLGLIRIIAIVALAGWTTVARLARGMTLAVRRSDYVRAAEALGAGAVRVMIRHVLPNIAGPIVVATTLAAGNIILIESVLSFLGLGIQPPLPSWGNMLTNAQDMIWSAPAQAVWPGLLIFLTVIGCNLLGDGLRESLDPRRGHGRGHG